MSNPLKNKYGYPEAVVLAIQNDGYSRGDSEFSATSLIEPPRKAALIERHKSEIESDVDDRIFILYGQLGHQILERAGRGIGPKHVVEKRFFGTIEGTKISAQIDSLDLEADGTLSDYKFTTVWGFKRDSKPKSDWIKQMNIQLELLRQNGLDAKRLRIWGMLRDWRPGEAKKESGSYPNKMAFHDIPIMDRDETRAMIAGQIEAHRKAKVTLPLCSDEDRWAKRDPFARCNGGYCEAAPFCDQFKNKETTNEV